jgi:hypothetical protein
VTYAIPAALTTGETNVTVLFVAHSGNTAGGVFGLQTVTAADPGTFLGIAMTLQSTLALGASSPTARIVGNFQNLTNHSILSSPWLSLASGNTNVIVIGPNDTLIAVGPGTAYLGQTVSQIVTVVAAALQLKLNGDRAVISWPSNSATLQSALELGPSNAWLPATDAIVFGNGSNSITVQATDQARFFRLKY